MGYKRTEFMASKRTEEFEQSMVGYKTRTLEGQVLVDLIKNPGIIPIMKLSVNRDMFVAPELRKVWDTLIEMDNEGTTIDMTTVGARIDGGTYFEIEGYNGASYVGTQEHCSVLIDTAIRRMISAKAFDIMSKAGDSSTPISTLLSMPGELASELAGYTRSGADSQTVTDVLNSYEEELQDRANGKIRKVPTGFPRLDFLIMGGWTNGNLITMSARPSVGKSALMLQMALSASRAGFPAVVYSLEMPNSDIGQRLIWSTGHVRPREMTSDQAVRNLDWDRIEKANGEFDKLPLWFNTQLRTVDEICNDIVLMHQRKKCAVAFIDHLHILSGGESPKSFYQVITERTRRFKLLAMDCGIPIVLLCQLNRMSESENRAPELYDLRDSGSIEQDSDIVLMLDRKDKTAPNMDIYVRKNRNGKTGRINLTGDMSRGFTVFSESENDVEESL